MKIPPLSIGIVVDEVPGVHRNQLVQTTPTQIELRLEPEPGAKPDQVWRDVFDRLGAYLARQGLANVELVRIDVVPTSDPVSGKFRHVMAVRPTGGP